MNTIELFEHIFNNLKVSNVDEIRKRRDQITKSLNRNFRDSDSQTSNRLMVGSWGRHTAIDGISDLDLIYILPDHLYDEAHKEKGTSKILSRVREAITARYPSTSVKVDRLVVIVEFSNYKFEVLPCFERSDGSFEYPDTRSDTWKRSDPRSEIKAMSDLDSATHGNARTLCRLTRAWKRKHEVNLGGLLIDTLVWRFFEQTDYYQQQTLLHDKMLLDFFTYLSALPKQSSWRALGSNQRVKAAHFQAKAKKAARLCQEAIDAEGTKSMAKKWRTLLGKFVPTSSDRSELQEDEYVDTEQFIEDLYPVALTHRVEIVCKVTQNGFRPQLLADMVKLHFPLLPNRTLEFTVVETTVPAPYTIRWKVLNRGDEARKRNCIRGQITSATTSHSLTEHTQFSGPHYVECYVIKDDVVLASARHEVTISV